MGGMTEAEEIAEELRVLDNEITLRLAEVKAHNQSIFKDFSQKEHEDFSELLGDMDLSAYKKIEYVDAQIPTYVSSGAFTNVHIEQWQSGEDGYSGYIYAQFKGKWLKIPYCC